MNHRLPNLQELFYRLAGVGAQRARESDTNADSPARFPVVVHPSTRRFLQAEAQVFGTSIAGMAGSILDAVAQTTTGADPGALALRSIGERLHLLLREHDLSIPAAAEVLAPFGIGLSELSSASTLEPALKGDRVRQIADYFHANYEWLVGKDGQPGRSEPHSWYKAAAAGALRAYQRSLDGWEVRLLLVRARDHRFDDARALDHADVAKVIPVLESTRTLECGEDLTCYEQWETGSWSYWKSRYYLKIMTYFLVDQRYSAPFRDIRTVHGVTLETDSFRSLEAKRAIPASVLRQFQRVDWHPDDYVIPSSAVAKEIGEWRQILESQELRSELNSFEPALKQLLQP